MAILLKVSAEEDGQKLFNFLQRCLNNEKVELHRWIRSGQVRINSARVKAFDRVSEGDTVRIPPFAEEIIVLKQNNNVLMTAQEKQRADRTKKLQYERHGHTQIIEKIYEDNNILVINKPFDLPCQGGTGQDVHLAQILKDTYKHVRFIPAPAHRLDKQSTGLVLIGKSYKGLRFLSDFMQQENKPFSDDFLPNQPHKEYLAWVHTPDMPAAVNAVANNEVPEIAPKTVPTAVNAVDNTVRRTFHAPKIYEQAQEYFVNNSGYKQFYMVHYLYHDEEHERMQALSLQEICEMNFSSISEILPDSPLSNSPLPNLPVPNSPLLDESSKEVAHIMQGAVAFSEESARILGSLPSHILLKNKANIQAQIAFSLVQCIKVQEKFSLLKIGIFTGRKHQIRVQCARLGFSLVGDAKYGNKSAETLKLHAHKHDNF